MRGLRPHGLWCASASTIHGLGLYTHAQQDAGSRPWFVEAAAVLWLVATVVGGVLLIWGPVGWVKVIRRQAAKTPTDAAGVEADDLHLPEPEEVRQVAPRPTT